MANKKLELRIIMPNVKSEEKPPQFVDMVVVPCINGELGILPSRLPCSMVLRKGAVRVFDGDSEIRININGGIASMSRDIVTVLSN